MRGKTNLKLISNKLAKMAINWHKIGQMPLKRSGDSRCPCSVPLLMSTYLLRCPASLFWPLEFEYSDLRGI